MEYWVNTSLYSLATRLTASLCTGNTLKYVWESKDILASHTKPNGKQHIGHELLLFQAKRHTHTTHTSDIVTYRHPDYRHSCYILYLGIQLNTKDFKRTDDGTFILESRGFSVPIKQNNADHKKITVPALIPSRTLSVLHNKCNLNIIQRMSTNRPLSLYTGCDNDILIKLGTS